MALHWRSAGWRKLHPAGRSRTPAVALLAAGAISLVAGASILASSLAPMFGIGGDAATITASPPLEAPAAGDSSGGLSVPGWIQGAVNEVVTAPAIIDRPVDGVAFQIRVPAVGYSATVREGVSAAVLMKGPGHYPTTAWPGNPGNVGVAAHNVYWLSFNRLKAGDRVEIQTRRGLFVYEITGSRVVDPNDRTVLRSTAEHQLTLTTCYPLWAGAYATKRLIFSAREIGGVA